MNLFKELSSQMLLAKAKMYEGTTEGEHLNTHRKVFVSASSFAQQFYDLDNLKIKTLTLHLSHA